MKHKHLTSLFLIVFFTTFDVSHAKSFSEIPNFHRLINSTHQWKIPAQLQDTEHQFLLTGVLSFIAAVISSAGGIGGGGLFVPILTIVAGFDLKTASAYSAFMVTGGSIANVASHILAKRGGGKPLIDYDIALLSEPCMLLGVSCGVIFNLMFPEWLITVIFAVFLAFCTFKTWKTGVLFWKLESDVRRRNGCLNLIVENGESTKMPLLGTAEVDDEGKFEIPLVKLGMLVLIWFTFFILYLLRGNRYGQGIINIVACGTGYWIISSIQVPVAIIFTVWILHCRKSPKNTPAAQQEREDEGTSHLLGELFFPIMTFLAGVLGGVFGIGGGMLISPLLLEIGVQPEVTAATCSFMVLFSSTMSAVQYLFLGMEHVYGAVIYAVICFSASLVGLTLVQRAINKHGRASLIVFSVGTVMALSTLLITSFGVVNVWKDYYSGKSMGFKTPC